MCLFTDATGWPSGFTSYMSKQIPIDSDTENEGAGSSTRTRRFIDIWIVVVTGTLCAVSTYWLINRDFSLIYAVGFLFTASATWLFSCARLKNGFLALSCLLLMLSVSEVVLSHVTPSELESNRNAARYTRGYSQPLRRNGGDLGFEPIPDRQVEVWKTLGDKRIFDVVYTITPQGFRYIPGFDALDASRALIVFLGGSYAFGEGLDDDETLPYFLAAKTNWSLPTLNVAFSGYGSHQMLRTLELGRLHDLGYERIRAAVYVALPGHANRAAGEVWWDPVGPKYELDASGRLQYRGRFTEVPNAVSGVFYRYLQLIQVARRSRVMDRAINLVAGAESANPAANAELMAQIVSRSAAILDEQYHAKLTVLFWDDDSELSSLVLAALAEKGIHVLKVSEVIPLSERHRYEISQDGHPNAAANELLAEYLIRSLGFNRP